MKAKFRLTRQKGNWLTVQIVHPASDAAYKDIGAIHLREPYKERKDFDTMRIRFCETIHEYLGIRQEDVPLGETRTFTLVEEQVAKPKRVYKRKVKV